MNFQGGTRIDHPNPMEIIMFRTAATAALLALTAVTAQAGESLVTRVHVAAVAACAPETASSLPVSHYGAISQYCVDRLTRTTLAKIQANAYAKTQASTALNLN